MRLLVTDAAAQPPRQATAWLIMTFGNQTMHILMALVLVGLLTFCPKIFISGMSQKESFIKGSVPDWILFSEKDMRFILSWRFRIYILTAGMLMFFYERFYQ